MPPKSGARGGSISYETWKAELVGLHGFLTQLGSAAISDQHSNHVMGRLKLVAGLTAEQGVEAVTLIKSGPWQDGDKEKLTAAVSQVLLGQAESSPKRRPSQQVQSFSFYFTTGDISIVADAQVSLATKIDCILDWPYSSCCVVLYSTKYVYKGLMFETPPMCATLGLSCITWPTQGIANRLQKVRLFCPSEQAWGAILKTACAAGFPSQHDTGVLRELKAKVKRGDKGSPHEALEYPVNPKELPFYDSAYQGEELAQVDEERVLATAVSLRKTNKEAKARRDSRMDASSNVSTQSGGLSKDEMLVMLFNVVMKGGKPNQEIDIEMLQPKKKPKALPEPERTAVPAKKDEPASGSTTPAVPGATPSPPAVPAIEDRKPESDGHVGPSKRSLLETSFAPEADDDLGPDDLVGLMKKPSTKTTSQKKPASKKQAQGKKGSTKPAESCKKKHGWVEERRYRKDGQVDVHYRSPKGPVYRTLKEARANGYRD